MRLQPNSISVWKLKGRIRGQLPQWAEFTNRFSKDYRTVSLYYPDPDSLVQELQVAGDFNNWVASSYATRRMEDTLYVEIPLKPGNYQYKLVLNGVTWIADPGADNFTPDPYGGRNSLLTVRK